MKKLIFSLIFASQALFAQTPESASAPTEQAIKAEGTWIDVRTPEEYNEGHLENAHNIPFDEIGEKIAELKLNKDAPIHLYCKSGRRAGIALDKLKELGYTNVQNHGGYEDLKKQGLK